MRDIWAKGTQSQLDLWSSNIVQVAHELRQPLNHQRQMPIKYLAEDANRQSLRESSLESQIAFCSSQGRDLYGVWWWFSRQVMSDSHFLMDCSLPGSSVHGILQARILEWVAISFSRGSSWPRDRSRVSCVAGGFFTDWATREALVFARG